MGPPHHPAPPGRPSHPSLGRGRTQQTIHRRLRLPHPQRDQRADDGGGEPRWHPGLRSPVGAAAPSAPVMEERAATVLLSLRVALLKSGRTCEID